MPEMHLRQPQFTYSPCGPFTKHKQGIQKFMQTGDTNYINKNELDKPSFFCFFNWYSLHASLNSHYDAWSYKKRKHKKVKAYRKSI